MQKQTYYNQMPDKKKNIIVFCLVYILFFSRYLLLGFRYYPQLDDYVQYYGYANFYSLSENIKRMGLLSARPFSVLTDIVLWSKFFEKNMIIAVAIISFLYVLSAFLFKKIFEKYFTIGNLFYIIYLFLPIGFEGLYWVSASSRIAVGMGLISLSLYLFVFYFIEKKSKLALALSFLIQLFAFGLYEPILVLGITVFMMVLILEFIYNRKNMDKRYLFAFFIFLNVAIIYAIMKLNPSDSIYSSRYNFVIFTYTLEEYLNKLLYLNLSFIEVFVSSNICLILIPFFPIGKVKGFWSFLTNLFFYEFKYILIACLLIILIFIILKYLVKKKIDFKDLTKLIVGYLLYLAPLSTLFLVESNHISFRNAVTSFLGLAILADLIWSKVSFHFHKYLKAVLISALFVILFLASYNEISIYKKTYEMDTRVSNIMANHIEKYGLKDVDYIMPINLKESYVEDKTIIYFEHLRGTTSSDWASRDHLIYTMKDKDIPEIIPIYTNTKWRVPIEKEMYESIKNDLINDSDKLIYLSDDNKESLEVFLEKDENSENMVFEIIDSSDMKRLGSLELDDENESIILVK